MLTLTVSFVHWLGFDFGCMSQYAGNVENIGDEPSVLYRINNYYLNAGVVSLAWVGFRKRITKEELDRDIEGMGK